MQDHREHQLLYMSGEVQHKLKRKEKPVWSKL